MNYQTTELSWDVISEPLFMGTQVSRKKALLRSDNQAVLGIVGEDYQTFSNKRFFAFAKALASEGHFVLRDFVELRGGRVILAYLENIDFQSQSESMQMNGYRMKEYLVLGNSHDGTKPFYVGSASSLVRCENQFYSTLKVFSKKHTTVLEVNEANIQNVLRNYQIRRKNLYSSFIGLDQIEIDSVCVEKLVVEIHKMLQGTRKTKPKEAWGQSASMILLKNCIEKEMSLLGQNAFGLFNGITWYTSHEMRGANSPYASPEGTAHRINQKAFQYCMHLKTTSQVKTRQAV